MTNVNNQNNGPLRNRPVLCLYGSLFINGCLNDCLFMSHEDNYNKKLSIDRLLCSGTTSFTAI